MIFFSDIINLLWTITSFNFTVPTLTIKMDTSPRLLVKIGPNNKIQVKFLKATTTMTILDANIMKWEINTLTLEIKVFLKAQKSFPSKTG